MFAGGSALPFAQKGAAGIFGGRLTNTGQPTGLLMDEASRMARAKELGYSETPFYRGEATGNLPSEYPSGAHYSRDQSYAAGFAQAGGKAEPREFRLDLRNTFNDKADLSAQQYSRLVAAADPTLAGNLVDMVAPGKSVEWFHEFAKRNPDFAVTSGGGSAMMRHVIEKNAKDALGVFRDAGFNAIDSGRDVRTLTGFGQRLKDAAFDPAKARLRDITGPLLPRLRWPIRSIKCREVSRSPNEASRRGQSLRRISRHAEHSNSPIPIVRRSLRPIAAHCSFLGSSP
jgi:hypothetical protein